MDPQLQEMVTRIRRLGSLAEEAAPDVAQAIRNELRRTVLAGSTPEGKPWAPRKHDGGRALPDAADALHVGAHAGTIYVRLTGAEVRHHQGRGRGGIMRRVIPAGENIPPRMAAAIRVELDKHFDRLVTGG